MKPSTPQAFAAALARQIRKARRRYRVRLERCQRKFSEPAVHELRIATRRMLALTDLLEALGVGEGPARIRRLFKRRLDAFDALRDAQVQRQRFGPFRRCFPVVRELDRWLQKRERKLVKQLRRDVKSLRQGRLERWLKAVEKELDRMDDPTGRKLGPKVVTTMNRAFARVTTLHGRVRAAFPATIHRLRIAFKQHRYLCELLQPLQPGLLDLDLKAMHRFQNLMGDIQDCEVMLAGITEALSAGQISLAAATELQHAVLAHRARRIKTFLDKAGKLREFQPKPVSESRSP